MPQSEGRFWVAVLGSVILVWTTARMFGALDGVSVAVYDDRGRVSTVGKLFDSTVMLLTVALATVTLRSIGVPFAFVVGDGLLLQVLSPAFMFVTPVAVFLLMSYLVLDTDVSVREVLTGTVFAAAAWTVSSVAVRLYAIIAHSVRIYGAIGVSLLVLVWLCGGDLTLVTDTVVNPPRERRIDPDSKWMFPPIYLGHARTCGMNTTRLVAFGRSFAGEVSDKRITFIAASLAYYAFISLIPLLLFALVLATTFGGQSLAQGIINAAGTALSGAQKEQITDILTDQEGAGGATVAGAVVLLWSALKIFRGLDVAFSQTYGRTAGGIAEQIKNGVATLFAMVLGVAITIGVGAAISMAEEFRYDIVLGGASLVGTVGTIVLLAALTLTLLPLYYVLPGGDVTVREALPGAAFAAIGWTLLQTLFRVYAANAGNYEAYGAIGGALLLVTLLYFAGMVLLLGVVLNAVLSGRTAGPTRVHDEEGDWAARLRAGGRP